MSTKTSRRGLIGSAATVLMLAGVAGAWWVTDGNLGQLPQHLGWAKPVPSDAQRASSASRDGRTAAVEVATVQRARTSTDVRAIGSLQSDESVQVAPEIAGRVSEIVVQEGRAVKSGEVLVKLDDALVAAEVTDAKARLDLASANNERARQLSRTGNVTERSRDEATANFETARAALELAKTRLSKHVLRAPFDAIAGVRSVSVGAFVATGTPILNLEKIDRLKVDFKVPETYLQDIKVGQEVEVALDAIPNRTFKGAIYAINPLIDVDGRALQIRALLDNKERILRPGLFARILIKGLSEREVAVVPEAAVMPRGGDAFVFKVVDQTANETRVRLGQRSNAQVEILDGLQPGDTVIVAGQHKLRNGASVDVTTPPSGAAQNSQPSSSAKAARDGRG